MTADPAASDIWPVTRWADDMLICYDDFMLPSNTCCLEHLLMSEPGVFSLHSYSFFCCADLLSHSILYPFLLSVRYLLSLHFWHRQGNSYVLILNSSLLFHPSNIFTFGSPRKAEGDRQQFFS